METYRSRPIVVNSDGRLADNIVYFARTLRKAGMRVGPASVKDAIEAVLVAGIGSRDDFYWTLHAVLVIAARGPSGLRRGVPAVLEVARADREDAGDVFAGGARQPREAEAARRRNARREAMFEGHRKDQKPQEIPEIEVDARFTFSGNEVLRDKDFAQMTAAEIAERKAGDRRAQAAVRHGARRAASRPTRTAAASIRAP